MVECVWRRQNDYGSAGSAAHHCHIVETGNESYRLRHSTLAAQTKIKSRERKRKDGDDIGEDEPF